MKNHKKLIRKMVLELRDSLKSSEITEKSGVIVEKLLETKEFKSSSLVMCYINFKSEVITKNLIDECLKRGKRVAVPYTIIKPNGQKEMIASEIFGIEEDTAPGRYGIFEPKPDKIRKIQPSKIDLAVVPGIAFDIRRNRIGYGAGYYDRFLKKMNVACFKVGLAFDIQIIEEVPVDRYDVPLQMIITESAVF